MPRRHRQRNGNGIRQDQLPFLTIMLGLMSVMALSTIGITTEQRRKAQDQVMVQLAEIPDELLPLQIRCKQRSVQWQDDEGDWQSLSITGILMLLRTVEGSDMVTPDAARFRRYLIDKVRANRALSYQRKQHTLILWVEPTGVQSAILLEHWIGEMNLPIRVGKLPALDGDRILSVPRP